jgi:dTDP-4-dehydrorhamnose reductase
METKLPSCVPEIWGGIECTINRVRDSFRDQLSDTGHYTRKGDIGAFAGLGISKIRYPVLWEKHLPDENGKTDWRWARSRLSDLRNNNIIPIVGLLHHGSGPVTTNLLDEEFPEKLAAYAGRVAKEFPWVEYYTPVNEPLTTARFSGLYGFWYPHHRDERSFIRMLLNQVKAIILSMKEIRKVNPKARLVQTEDLCKIHSTTSLAYQAAYENERRWLTYDLLCGKLVPGHRLWNHLLSLGISKDCLQFFAANACPPDIMGFNYYVTSERYLDDRLHNYPDHLHGGNSVHRYVDADAARAGQRCGLGNLLTEAWERYHLNIAITECHLNCSREEQMRWLKETWDVCCSLRQQNIPVLALTAWSLLGSFDWDTLLLEQNGHYESGIYDISNGDLRPTILEKMIRSYARGQKFQHPLLAGKGWWHANEPEPTTAVATAPLLIIGNDSPMKEKLRMMCAERRIDYRELPVHESMDSRAMKAYQNGGIRKCWGIIEIINGESGMYGMHEWVKDMSGVYNIPLLVIQTQSMEFGDTDPINYLYVQAEETDGMKFVQPALDLFIDGEKGAWVIAQQGVQQGKIKEPALY